MKKNSIKIALLGYGKMGQQIEKIAIIEGHTVVARFSKQNHSLKEQMKDLTQADVAIDFSHSSSVLNHLNICLSLRKPLVIGTTGWEDQLLTAQHLVQQAKGSCLFAPNFSIGFFLFQQTMNYAAALFQLFSNYDVSGIEYHHRQKTDSPSGTAKLLRNGILKNMPRLDTFEFASIRCGHMPGTHTIFFDGPADTLTFTHQARNREDFAQGALLAAQWLIGQKGFFGLEDVIHDYIKKNH